VILMSEMSENDNTPKEIPLEKPMQIKDDEKITVKKSTYNNMLKGLIAAVAIAAFVGGYSLGTFDNSDSGLTGEELKEILSEIRPAAPQPVQQPGQPSAPLIIQVSLDDDPFKGNADAPVIMIEFSDFQCPFCLRFYEQTLPAIIENYVDTGKVKFVYRDLPLDSLHPNARPVHIAAECADEQGKFWDYHDMLFDNQSEWGRLPAADLQNTLTQYASDLGLESASFETCLESDAIADEVNKDTLDAARYGATGTPAFFIGNEKDGFIKLSGAQPYQTFQAAIDAQLG